MPLDPTPGVTLLGGHEPLAPATDLSERCDCSIYVFLLHEFQFSAWLLKAERTCESLRRFLPLGCS